MLLALSLLEWFACRWGRALDQANAGLEVAEQTRNPHVRGLVGARKALIEVDLGLVEQARTSAEEGLRHSREMSDDLFAIPTLAALGRLELSLGNLEAAAGHLRDLPGRLLGLGWNDPTVTVWADVVETLVGLGELEQAAAHLDHYERSAERLGSPWALAGAARCRGLLAAARGDPEAAQAAFRRSLAALDGAPHPFERARTLLCLGSAHRQARQKGAARDALEEALATFEELGARLWAEKARAELRRISGRRRAAEDLTESEERVAVLAAAGRSNREIAAALYMSVHTVGAHLSRTYRKLDVRSRTELTARLAKLATEPAKVANQPAKPTRRSAKV
jgi:DNA-binding CsgD family transcriptional regulator